MDDPTAVVDRPDAGPGGTATKVLATVAVLLVALSVAVVSSLALFTDSETVSGNTVATGTIDLTATPATAVLTTTAMVPGDQVTSTIDVTNAGSLELRYAARSNTDEDTLASALVLTVKSGVTTCDDANWAADGAVLYTGPLGSLAGTAMFGSAAQGAQAGDRVLAAGATETLCLNLSLPLSTTSTAQGLTSTATFTFDAEQTANNP